MKKGNGNFGFNFWMVLFLLLTGGIMVYVFWPKIKELLMDLMFLRDFLKEKVSEKKDTFKELEEI